MKEDPEPGAKCRDKFLVQSIIITPERESTAFPELWSLIEKESKGSIAEHKIRCVYLSANSEDGQQSPNSASHNSTLITPPLPSTITTIGMRTIHPASGFIRPQVSPPDQPTNDNPESTVYDIAMDETFDGRANRPSTTGPSLAALQSAQLDPLATVLECRLARSIARLTDDIHKVKSQLAAALAEVERLKASAASSRDQGLRKRTPNSSATDSQRVHSADMLALNTHGLKGPEGLVPVCGGTV
ncbi:phosphatidylinositol-binding protein scs2 [Puccinia graminis f. sp. tritici]|uniref:Phosphatidylinositol-binding protein scs2 n=1 Tax=Puccinia graminis f. sp. tritici TaxID=56615 RepID=A0A5B0RHZ6_PUCGR|nr:phosphatidylinositol-binding protein scs2 [Puccinia graminis f. sp. tritici]